jgi:hypothetical protein
MPKRLLTDLALTAWGHKQHFGKKLLKTVAFSGRFGALSRESCFERLGFGGLFVTYAADSVQFGRA